MAEVRGDGMSISKLSMWEAGELITAGMFNNLIMDNRITDSPKRKCDYCGVYSKDEMSCPQCGAPINWGDK